MKKMLLLPVAFCFAAIAHAQDNEKIKEVVVTGKKLSDTTIKRIKRDHNADQKVITLRFKGDKAENQKYTIEVDGDKIKVNGKDIADVKDVDVSIGQNRVYFRNGTGNFQAFGPDGPVPFEKLKELKELRGMNGDHLMAQGMLDKKLFEAGEPRAFLGVSMEKADKGVRVTEITEKSAAEKAGLKKDDIIVSLDGKKVVSEMEVTNIIKAHKPGEEVEVVYSRDGKENKVKAALGKREPEDLSYWYDDGGNNKGMNFGKVFDLNGKAFDMNGKNFDMNQKFDLDMDKMKQFEYKLAPGMEWNGQGKGEITVVGMHRPRLGVNIKETESGKGLEITEVTEGSVAAKAGLQKGDIINEVGGKAVSTVEDIRKAVNEAKSKPFNVNYTRNGSSKNVEIKFPKDLKEGGL